MRTRIPAIARKELDMQLGKGESKKPPVPAKVGRPPGRQATAKREKSPVPRNEGSSRLDVVKQWARGLETERGRLLRHRLFYDLRFKTQRFEKLQKETRDNFVALFYCSGKLIFWQD